MNLFSPNRRVLWDAKRLETSKQADEQMSVHHLFGSLLLLFDWASSAS
jgi:hypothetical protein